MTHSAAMSPLGSEFNDFLFAPIGEDRNDMPLSVLSALARLDIDPWQEAGRLAQLPGETATQRLASLIAALPAESSLYLDPGTIAARLIKLLPRRATPNIPPRGLLSDASETAKFRFGLGMYAVFIVFMLTVQWISASHQPTAQVDGTQTSAASAVTPQTPVTNSGQ
jgi:hypothetical protein